MRTHRKFSSVNLERRFDFILLRAENEASQTLLDENKLRIRRASNLRVVFCIERQKRIKSLFNNS